MTACTGIYQNDKGKMTGIYSWWQCRYSLGSRQNSFRQILLKIEADESFEIRITSRANIFKSKDKGVTGWLDAGVSIGYEF